MVDLNDNFEIRLEKAVSDFQTKWFRQSTSTRAQLSVAVCSRQVKRIFLPVMSRPESI